LKNSPGEGTRPAGILFAEENYVEKTRIFKAIQGYSKINYASQSVVDRLPVPSPGGEPALRAALALFHLGQGEGEPPDIQSPIPLSVPIRNESQVNAPFRSQSHIKSFPFPHI
jgi:hypothetical protein